MMKLPDRKGHIEISVAKDDVFGQGVFIGGDPEGLRSLAELLLMLADLDQGATLEFSPEVREHIYLRPNVRLSGNSAPTELCRLDAKITGEFPADFIPADAQIKKRRKP
jgi:hypothetical protein